MLADVHRSEKPAHVLQMLFHLVFRHDVPVFDELSNAADNVWAAFTIWKPPLFYISAPGLGKLLSQAHRVDVAVIAISNVNANQLGTLTLVALPMRTSDDTTVCVAHSVAETSWQCPNWLDSQ
jgi:hypothetical protein